MQDYIYSLIFSGALKIGGTWGGDECAAHISRSTHIMECIVWTILIVISAYLFDVPRSLKEVLAIKSGGKLNTIDYLFAAIHIGMWLQVIYYKINLMSLVNLLQTCHLILLWDSIVLLSYNPIRLLLGLLVFIMTIGVLLAILFPATEGLDQYLEAEAFFVQHYLLMITPLYLLCRHNFEFLKQIKFRFILLGGWMCFCLHWFFFAHFDRHFKINIGFFLCPTNGMVDVFALLPWWAQYPTFRTACTVVMFLTSIVLSYIYIAIAYILSFLSSQIFRKADKIV